MAKKSLIKICMLVVVILMMSFSGLTFAADDTELMKDVAKIWYLIASILSRIWILFAQGASEFLSNKWVYGEIIWLDTLLWKLWNLIKNFANFWLWFYFVYKLFEWLIKWEIEKKLKGTLLWLLVAWVWIQASWFFTAVVLDVSTVTLVATSSLSSQLVSLDESTSENMFRNIKGVIDGGIDNSEKIENALNISLFPQNEGAYGLVSTTREVLNSKTEVDKKSIMDQILPNAENLSWPLYYLWFFVLKSTNMPTFDSSKDSIKTLKSTILNILIQCWTIMIYSLEMIVLFVVAIMRVIYIWIFIVLSPLVVLLWCIRQANGGKWGNEISFLKWLTKHFNFSSFFWNAFKPAIIVLWFSLAMIFVTLMTKVVTDSADVDVWWEHFTSYVSKEVGEKKYYTSSVEWDVLSFTLRNSWKTILEVVVSIITVILVYLIISIAVNLWGEDFLSQKAKKVQWLAWDLLWTVPIVPVPWYDKNWQKETHYISAWKVFGIWNKTSLLKDTVSHYQNIVSIENEEDQKVVRSLFGNTSGYLSQQEQNTITQVMSGNNFGDLKKVKAEIDKISDKNWKWMTLNLETSSNDGFWLNQFGRWLSKVDNNTVIDTNYNTTWKNMIVWWNSEEAKKIEDKMLRMQTMFTKVPDSVKAYADFFGLSLTSYDWEHLKELDISKK